MMRKRLACFCLALMLVLPWSGLADIACDCLDAPCSCFLQIGDTGPAVKKLMQLMKDRKYLTAKQARGDEFRTDLENAVCQFQTEHGLEPTGMLDDVTLSLLLTGYGPIDGSRTVWLPTNGGKKYHYNPTCCDMISPRKVSESNAILLKIDLCKICLRNAN